MIEDISSIIEIEEQNKKCDICIEEIVYEKYMSITSSKNKTHDKFDNNNEHTKDNKYYIICLECVEKIRDLLTYNYGFEGDLIKFFKVLVEEKKDI